MGGPSGSSGTPSNSSSQAVSYQPAAQPQADVGYQSLLGGFFGGLGPSFQGTFGGSSNMFSGTPGGVSYGMAAPFVGGAGSNTITDPNNLNYNLAQSGAQTAAGAGYDALTGTAAPAIAGALSPNFGLSNNAATGTSADLSNYAGFLNSVFGNTAGAQFANATNNQIGIEGMASQLSPNVGALQNAGNTLLQSQFPAAINEGGAISSNASRNYAALAPEAMAAAQNSGNIGNLIMGGALNSGQGITNAGNTLLQSQFPAAINEGGALQSMGSTIAGYSLPQALQNAGSLTNSGNQILGTAFDPQGALQAQLQNQVSQQANAANAAAGLGGSAYGASNAANALGNFDINWQNAQLARQAQGLSSAQGAYGTAAGLPGAVTSPVASLFQTASALPGNVAGQASSLLQAGAQLPGAVAQQGQNLIAGGQALPGAQANQEANLFGAASVLPGAVASQGGNLLNAAGNQASGISQLMQGATQLPLSLAQGYGNLGSTIGNLGSAAATLPYQSLAGLGSTAGTLGNLYSQSANLAGLPYNTQSTQANNALSVLGNYTNLGNQQYTIPQQTANDLQSYLQLGQAASGLSGQLGALGQSELGSSLAGIGGALGTGSNLLFGNQGLSGALGLGSSGLLGGLGGAGASSVLTPGVGGAFATAPFTDLAASAAPAAATGGGFSLGSLLPFGAGS